MPMWPLPTLGDRLPVISHEFEPIKHLGVDIMYRRLSQKGFEVPEGVYVRAAVAGRVLYAKNAFNGFRVRIRDAQGTDWLYLHMSALSVHQDDVLAEGTRLGLVGADPSPADAAHIRHLHFEMRKPLVSGGVQDGFDRCPVDPTAFLKGCTY